MGIKHFFIWFRNRFSKNITEVSQSLEDNVVIDNLMIDMNGLFHQATQKVYKYGEHKVHKRLLGNTPPERINFIEKQTEAFESICESINKIVNIVKPKKRIILCIDGPAPNSKQKQMRQRRFSSAQETPYGTFDRNSITPGTKFMDMLSRYIDWYIRNMVSTVWNNIEVIFSNEKVPGEGEHKLINYIRKYGNRNESYCIHGMDADLIMLSLGTQFPNMYILRDEVKSENPSFYLLNIGLIRNQLSELMKWDEEKVKFDKDIAIYDFIFMCFVVGNDFLPNIPGIEIILGGIDFMIDIYKIIGSSYGHLTKIHKDRLYFRKNVFAVFLATLSIYEKDVFEDKLKDSNKYFPDKILQENSSNGKVDIDGYRNDYHNKCFPSENMENVCHDYLQGLQWVLSYYIYGVPDWKWNYKYHYAPFTTQITRHIKTFKFVEYIKTYPTLPFVQLLSVLPPKSAHLLPKPLDSILKSRLNEYCPDVLQVDLSGKRQKWEGVVLLPTIDYSIVEKEYNMLLNKIGEKERKRNIFGRTFVYNYSDRVSTYNSYYGDLKCNVCITNIDL
jgi:5'-3' exonuclease